MKVFEKSLFNTVKLSAKLSILALLLTFCTCRNVSTTVPTPNDVPASIGSNVLAETGSKYADNKTDIGEDVQTLASNGSRDLKMSTAEQPVSDYDTSYSSMDLPHNGSFNFKNGGAVLRAFYVIMGFTLVVVVYFVLRAVRLRRKRNKSHKYGIVSTNGDMELTPFDVQDDDDETTVFEVAANNT